MSRYFFNVLLAASLVCLANSSAHADEPNDAAKSSIFDNNVLYLRAGHIDKNFVPEITTLAMAPKTTNQIVGTILDLRFADGTTADATQATVDYFAAKKLPLAILVNGETRGAAEELAAALRDARIGLVFGSAPAHLKPDIAVNVNVADEQKFLADPYLVIAPNTTNSPTDDSTSMTNNNFSAMIDHTSEADLVRQKIKDGDEDDSTMPVTRPAPAKPVVRDPALARALDFLKALAVLEPKRG